MKMGKKTVSINWTAIKRLVIFIAICLLVGIPIAIETNTTVLPTIVALLCALFYIQHLVNNQLISFIKGLDKQDNKRIEQLIYLKTNLEKVEKKIKKIQGDDTKKSYDQHSVW